MELGTYRMPGRDTTGLLFVVGGPHPYLWVGDYNGNCFGTVTNLVRLRQLEMGLSDGLRFAAGLEAVRTKPKPKPKPKRKREKPLHIPLSFEDAVTGLLQVDPKSKAVTR